MSTHFKSGYCRILICVTHQTQNLFRIFLKSVSKKDYRFFLCRYNVLFLQTHNSILITNKYIRKFLAIVLLAIFALSNTPTKYLHHLFANHIDFRGKALNDSNIPQLSVTGLNCHCESNVVIAPYTLSSCCEVKPLLPIVTAYSEPLAYSIIVSQSISFGLRGPPSVG